MKSRIEPASLSWDADGTPRNKHFDEAYFPYGEGQDGEQCDGLAESTQVFLQTNRLPERFAALGEHENFVIAETGFGSGLNFLLTWRCFKKHAPKTAKLSYISIEGYPLRPDDLHKCLAQWPELAELSAKLEAHYPVLVPGHHWQLFEGRIGLHLIFDQAEPALKSLHPKITHHNFDQEMPRVDAWFLDGFAPSKNPEMWQDGIYPSIARLSKETTSLSSYTAAADVRKNLQDWGFQVEKVLGYGKKLEMISAQFDPNWQPAKDQIEAHADKSAQTWHLPIGSGDRSSACGDRLRQVAILGGGVAGLTLAKSLADRGIKVRIFDKHPKPLSAASGNPQVAIFGRLSPDRGDLEDFVLQCLSYAADFYQPHWENGSGDNTGLLQIPRNTNELNKIEKTVKLFPNRNGLIEYLQSEHSKTHTGLNLNSDGLWFPKSGWISPAKFAENILKSDLIEYIGGQELFPQQAEERWHLQDSAGNNLHSCETLVICGGAESTNNPLFEWMPLKPVAGQVNLVPATPETSALTAILSQSTSISPADNGVHCLGGTYRLGETELDIRETDGQKNLDNVQQMLALAEPLKPEGSSARTGVRATTPDYLPICGSAPHLGQLRHDFAALAKDAKTPINKPASAIEGLYLNTGYGSRGYAYAPLCAEHLCSIICGQPSPLPNHLQRSVHPARFPIRDIIRGRK